MKTFKEGQIVKIIHAVSYYNTGEVAEVANEGELVLRFYDDENSSLPCEMVDPEHFDFYEKVA